VQVMADNAYLQDVEGMADVAAHALACARASGVPEPLCVELASQVFQEIVEEIPSEIARLEERRRYGVHRHRLCVPGSAAGVAVIAPESSRPASVHS
jgi:hypothetical protein